jgi:adenylosuccinate synthase
LVRRARKIDAEVYVSDLADESASGALADAVRENVTARNHAVWRLGDAVGDRARRPAQQWPRLLARHRRVAFSPSGDGEGQRIMFEGRKARCSTSITVLSVRHLIERDRGSAATGLGRTQTSGTVLGVAKAHTTRVGARFADGAHGRDRRSTS